MEQFNVTGMSCAACSARVEKAVGALEGVTACSVNLLTHSMGVEGSATAAEIIAAVEKAGYGASLKGAAQKSAAADEDALADHETPRLKKRLLASLGLLLLLMYVSMGHTMWGWPAPAFIAENAAANGLAQLLLSSLILVINQKFFISGFKGLVNRAPNMDTLVAMGSAASWIYSVYCLFAIVAGDHHKLHDLYFESAAMILALITVGKMLEARAKGKTTDALKSLMRLAPQTVTVIREGKESEIPIAELQKGDLFAVKPGESIGADGVVEEGHSAVNESALTGESLPVDKEPGSHVSAGTVNQSGYLLCRASRVGEDSTLSQIIRMVSDAAATKAPIAKIADKVSGVFVPTVLGIALVTLVVWLAVGQSFGFALARAISVLVISCPCALGLATPVAIMVGSGVGARSGILFKTAVSLENAGKAEICVLDKTGTITRGEPVVTDVVAEDENALLTLAAALEQRSEHPLAKAVLAESEKRGLTLPEVSDFTALPGHGLQAVLDGTVLRGGSLRYISENCAVSPAVKAKAEALAEGGKTPLLFARDGELLGMIAVADAIKPESGEAIRDLKNLGLKVVMLTGDNERSARAIGKEAGVDEVIAGVLPEGKDAVIQRLKQEGHVLMVGDGINDAPALTRADTGMAIGAGTDVAIDAADVVLMKSRLSDVPAAVRLSRATLTNIRENLFWAFIYNIIGIPLAAGVWIPIFGWQLSPMFGAAAMSLSSFCVVSNALRLNFFRLHESRRDRPLRHKKHKEEKPMEKVLKVEGIMCPHCEARVKKCLEAIDGVSEAVASHTEGTATVKLEKDVAFEVLKAAIEGEGYTVIG
ncbi:MAG: heavy metal translocating P-type ATPase [Ruminococcaceae bacterium]|nr:heavy metal translocating P-type ATPase [Oscillospiraceae bacterium]